MTSLAIRARNQNRPRAMATWCGLMRRRRTIESYSDGFLAQKCALLTHFCAKNAGRLVRVGLGVGLAEPLGHRRQQLVGQVGDLVDDARELALAEDEHLHVVLGHDRRRAGTAVEQSELAEVLAGAELGDLPLAALHRGVAADDEEELVSRLALLDEDLSLAALDGVGRPGEGLPLLLRQ